MQVNSLRSHNPNGGISIRERSTVAAEPSQPASAEEKQQQADADYARQLQAKLDAQEARGGNKSDPFPLCSLFLGLMPQACTVLIMYSMDHQYMHDCSPNLLVHSLC